METKRKQPSNIAVTQLPFSKASQDAAKKRHAQSSEEERQNRRDLYAAAREHALALRQGTFDEADKMVVTISSAFLGLSATFLHDLIPLDHAICVALMVLSWAAFASAIVAVFVSYWYGRKSMNLGIRRYGWYYLEFYEYEEVFTPDVNSAHGELCNLIAAICFVSGILLFGAFCGVNVLHESYGSSKNTLSPTKPTKPGNILMSNENTKKPNDHGDNRDIKTATLPEPVRIVTPPPPAPDKGKD